MRPLLGLMVFLLLCEGSFAKSFVQNVREQELLQLGKEGYLRRCSGCHGEKGDGKGPGSYMLDPKPRDFTSGVFKFSTTPLEALPSDEDLMKTITQGILGTSMPGFPLVSEVERFAIVQYIKSFSNVFNDPENIAPKVLGVTFPRDDFKNYPAFIKRAKKGREIFKDACVVCHGTKGMGDGPGSEDLEDNWGEIVKPANLTKAYIKSGKSVRYIYQVLLSGVNGTAMPAFKDVYTDDELWDLSAYVLYLRGIGQGVYTSPYPIKEITEEE